MRADRRVELGHSSRTSRSSSCAAHRSDRSCSDRTRICTPTRCDLGSRIRSGRQASVAQEPHSQPAFVFVHVPAPHPPVVFDAEGGAVNGSAGESVSTDAEPPLPRDERIARQLAETPWIATSDDASGRRHPVVCQARPPVIVVMSDHGTDIDWDANHPLDGGIGERSSNVLAVAAPGRSSVLPAGTTPVNVLVRILDAYGLADLPVQPDTTWSYKGPSDILDMVQVDPATARSASPATIGQGPAR